MSLFGKLFKKNGENISSKNVEDFVSLTRVYVQSVIAANLGITNIRFVPDVANFKRLFKIPTQGGRLGQAEKAASRKMLMQDYGISENFFKEIDMSIKKHCRTMNDVQGYLFMYQGFSNDLMMLMGNLMQWKFRVPSIFKGALRSMTEKTVHDVCTKTVWKKDDVHKTAMAVRQYKERLGYSEQWMTEYVYNVVMLAKKEPTHKAEEKKSPAAVPMELEQHPLPPFLPPNARLLMLGSFPPQRKRWSMEFFYPNWNNDMWRITGLLFFNDRDYFVEIGRKAFCRERLIDFLEERGIALYDTATCVRRLQDNASDKYLEIVHPTDIPALLDRLPQCRAIVTTGEKATETLCAQFSVSRPQVGTFVECTINSRPMRLYRMPSSSRAYPVPLEKKAAAYRGMYQDLQML